MSIEIQGIHHVSILSTDLDRSRAFYAGVLGHQIDLDLEVGNVLDALAHRCDLANPTLEDAIREGLRPNTRALADFQQRHLVLVH